ncbi:hypothetical protein [Clostridium sp.]|uniref:hypothetical protein n=1 Tax=Clostridium sp. TaxID=1506 RepID=UPI00321682C6
MLTILTVLNVVAIIAVVIYIGKNILCNYKLSDSTFKNTCIGMLLCVTAWCAFQGTYIGMISNQAEDLLEYNMSQTVTEEEKARLELEKEAIELNKKSVEKYTIVTYIAFAIVIVTQKSIDKKRNNTPTTSKWDLSKYK